MSRISVLCWSCRSLLARDLARVSQIRGRRDSCFIDPRKIESKVEKFMVRNKKLQKRFYDVETKVDNQVSTRLTPNMNRKELDHKTMLREKTIGNLLKNEILNLVDSGALGNEVQDLQVLFTKSLMSAKNICKILWEPQFSTKDIEISEILNRLSGNIRHMLITNHIMNNVPHLYFYIDPTLLEGAKVEQLFRDGCIDLGPEPTEEEVKEVDEKATEDEDVSLFGLDYDAMHTKLVQLKINNKVDKR